MKEQIKIVQSYQLILNGVKNTITIVVKEEEPVPNYHVTISNISETTKIILDKLRDEFVSRVDTLTTKENYEGDIVKEIFKKEIINLIGKYFPKADDPTKDMFTNYLISQHLGFGTIEILLIDPGLEEIVINNAAEFVWVYHKKHGWLKTNVIINKESKIRHYATIIGREINKEITLLNPLMDASLPSGDRVNATLHPISTKGNTITIRKFATVPWTVTDFIKSGTISYETAAFIWMAIQYEMSVLVAGGTGSGKTSALNVLSCFLPPNRRIISIEDTRELVLASNLHWVPMETRLANPEGKGGVSMLDLLVNSLRMRPDRILVGEIRRKEEAQVLLEAMHTGHSVYATMHANNAEEVAMRLTNPPIDIPKAMLTSVNIVLVQSRNRRTGKRRTFQLAEFDSQGDYSVFMQYNMQKDTMENIAEPKTLYKTLKTNAGLSNADIQKDIDQKIKILKVLVDKNINNVDAIGAIMAKYYLGTLDISKIK